VSVHDEHNVLQGTILDCGRGLGLRRWFYFTVIYQHHDDHCHRRERGTDGHGRATGGFRRPNRTPVPAENKNRSMPFPDWKNAILIPAVLALIVVVALCVEYASC